MGKKQQERELLRSQMEAASQLSRDMSEKLKARRRQSIMLNNEIRKRQEERLAEIEKIKKTEKDSLAQSRREDFEAVREAKKKDDMMRRQSMANKTEAAKQEREVQQDLDLKKKEQ